MGLFGSFKQEKGLSLRYPLQPGPKVAVFDERYRSGGSVVVVAHRQVEAVTQHKVDTVAATSDLFNLICALDWKPSHPMVVFSTPEERLTDSDRARLWQQFEVPVFEQVVDSAGKLLASECEAHLGLHIEVEGPFSLPDTEFTSDLCGCGRSGARLLPKA